MPFLVEKTTGDFQKVFIAFLEQEAELKEKINSIMDRFLSEHITTLGVGLILSIAIFGAFKAGQVFERSTISERIHEFDLEKLKQKTESKLEMLWKHYCDTNGKSTFTSITTPLSDLEVMCEQVGLIVKNLKVLLKRYLPVSQPYLYIKV